MLRRRSLPVCFALLLASRALAGAPTVVKDGEGEVPVSAGDEEKALNEATEQALRAAISAAASVPMKGESTVQTQFIREVVFSKRNAYLKNVGLVSARTEANVARAVMKVEVDPKALDQEIEAARKASSGPGKPAIVFLVAETMEGETSGKAVTHALVTALTQQLTADGFEVKDGRGFAGRVEKFSVQPLGEGEARELAESAKAHFLVAGTVKVKTYPGLAPADGKPGTFPVSGLYDLTLFAGDAPGKLGAWQRKLSLTGPGENEVEVNLRQTVSYERSGADLMQKRKEVVLEPLRSAMLGYAVAHPLKAKGCAAVPVEGGLALAAWLLLLRRRPTGPAAR